VSGKLGLFEAYSQGVGACVDLGMVPMHLDLVVMCLQRVAAAAQQPGQQQRPGEEQRLGAQLRALHLAVQAWLSMVQELCA